MKRTFTAVILGVALLVASGGSGYAQDFQKGLEAAQKGDFATALREWRPLAEQGHARAQYYLGLMYDHSHGVTKDYKEAAKWYRKSAEQGNLSAQFNLGEMYSKGWGVPQDYKEAMKWYRLSAEQGYAVAQSNLGLMYGFYSGRFEFIE